MPTQEDLEQAKEAVRAIEAGKEAGGGSELGKGTQAPVISKPVDSPTSPAQVPPATVPPAGDEPRIPQSRLDKEVSKSKALEDENARLKAQAAQTQHAQAQVPPPVQDANPLAKFSTDELLLHKQQNPDAALAIDKELHQRTKAEAIAEIRKETGATRATDQYNTSMLTKYPDLNDPNSRHSQLTKQLMDSNPEYSKHPAGKFLAAQQAKLHMFETGESTAQAQATQATVAQRQAEIDKEKAQAAQQLDTGGRHTAPVAIQDDLAKSEESLPSVRPGSPEMNAHMRLLETKKTKTS